MAKKRPPKKAPRATPRRAAPKPKPKPAKPQPLAKKVGRPSIYNEEVAEKICAKLAEGRSLREICRADGTLPSRGVIMAWAKDPAHPFAEPYRRARELGFWVLVDDLLDIADDGTNDYVERMGKDGEPAGYALNGEAVARSRLRVDARKWVLSKMLPRFFGEKLDLQHAGPDGGPIEIETVSKLDLARWVAQIFVTAPDGPDDRA